MGGARALVVGWTMSMAVCLLAAVGQTPGAEGPGASLAGKPRVEAIPSMGEKLGAAFSATKHKGSYEFKLTNADWLDTGVTLVEGEQASFAVTGSFTLGDGRVTGPEGMERGWKDLLRQFPLNSAKVGAVVGRVSDVGASVPFLVGSQSEVTIPTTGRLYLTVNVSNDLTATGIDTVKVTFHQRAKGTGPVTGGAVPVSALVSPATFADIPRRVTDEAGHAGDMVNYALVGTEAEVKAAFLAAGWVAVDKSVEDAVLHGLLSTLSHEAYTEMPMSTLYLFGRPQDLSFARGDPLKVAAERHHLRVWKTDQLVDGRPLWVGSCTHDIGFEKDQRNGGVTHKIDPKIDGERDFLLQSFDAAGVFSSAAYVTPDDPLLTAKTATGGSFYSDGRIAVMELR